MTADSIKFPDSLKYKTDKGRTVYGGGGIMPDIFIPLDTTRYSTLYNEMYRKGIISEFALDYMEKNREELKAKYATMESFRDNFEISDPLFEELMDFAHKEGVKDSIAFQFSQRAERFFKDKAAALDSIYKSLEDLTENNSVIEMLKDYVTTSFNETMRYRNLNKAHEFIKDALKYEFARNLFNYGEARQIFLMKDDGFNKALEVISNDKIFKKFNVEY
jgi:carboxyl-terminal processing protease